MDRGRERVLGRFGTVEGRRMKKRHESTPLFVVLAFRYGGFENVFPIGVFSSRVRAEAAAGEHRNYRGGK